MSGLTLAPARLIAQTVPQPDSGTATGLPSRVPCQFAAAGRPAAPTRDYAIAGQFARSATITDGRWTLHQGPDPEQPLYWYGYHLQRFYGGQPIFGSYADGRRLVLLDGRGAGGMRPSPRNRAGARAAQLLSARTVARTALR